MSPMKQISTAWIEAPGDLVLFAQCPADYKHPLESAITRLIIGINAEFLEERYRFLRLPIYCDFEPTPWEKHLVKVCAKRLRTQKKFDVAAVQPGKLIDIGAPLITPVHAERLQQDSNRPMDMAQGFKMVSQLATTETRIHQDQKRHKSPRPVASILLDAEFRIITAAVNTNHESQILHAEVNLVAKLRDMGLKRLPNNAILITSLKPCRMCAALLLALGARENNLRIRSVEDDTGTFGRHALLDGLLSFDLEP